MWGELKKKLVMNFDKFFCSLWYYYDKLMLRKVVGKENIYEFMWDIFEIIGYDLVCGFFVFNMRYVLFVFSLESRLFVLDLVNELNMFDEVDSFFVFFFIKVLFFFIFVNVFVF